MVGTLSPDGGQRSGGLGLDLGDVDRHRALAIAASTFFAVGGLGDAPPKGVSLTVAFRMCSSS